MTKYTFLGLPQAEFFELFGIEDDPEDLENFVNKDNDGGPGIGVARSGGTADFSGGLSVQRNGSYSADVTTFYDTSVEDDLGLLTMRFDITATQTFSGGVARVEVPVFLAPISSQAPLDEPLDVGLAFSVETNVTSSLRSTGPELVYSLSYSSFVARTGVDDVANQTIIFPAQQQQMPFTNSTLRFTPEVYSGGTTAGFTPFEDGSRVIDGVLKFGTQEDYGTSFVLDVAMPSLALRDDVMVEVDGVMVPANTVYALVGPENSGVIGVFPEEIPAELDGFVFEPGNIIALEDRVITARGTDEDGFEAGFDLFERGLEDRQIRSVTLDIPTSATITQTTLRPLQTTIFDEFQPVIAVNGRDVTIDNRGTISGLVENGAGILLTGTASDTSHLVKSTGEISTKGDFAPGILVAGNGSEIQQSGLITTEGDRSYGLWAVGRGLEVENSGEIETSGSEASGVKLGNANNRTVLWDQISPGHAELEKDVANELPSVEAAEFLAASTGSFVNKGRIETNAAPRLESSDGDGAVAPGLFAALDDSTITNDGAILAPGLAVVLAGKNLEFINSGNIIVKEGAPDAEIFETAILVDGSDRTTIENSGTVNGDIRYLGTDGVLVTSGEVNGTLQVGTEASMFSLPSGSFDLQVDKGGTLGDDADSVHQIVLFGEGDQKNASFSLSHKGSIVGGLTVLAAEQSIEITDEAATISSDGVKALALTGTVTATIGGTVEAKDAKALEVSDSIASSLDLTITDKGGIRSDNGIAVQAYVSEAVRVTNAGAVVATGSDSIGLDLFSSAKDSSELTSSGTVTANGAGSIGIRSINIDTTNTGTISANGSGSVAVSMGVATLTNTGVISADGTSGAAVLVNEEAGLFVGLSTELDLVNSGLIRGVSGALAIAGGGGDDRFVNAGQIVGDVALGAGSDTVTWREGASVNGTIGGGVGSDRIAAESGTIEGDKFVGFEVLEVTGVAALTGSLSVEQTQIKTGQLTLDGVHIGDVSVAAGAALVGSGTIVGKLNAAEGSTIGPGFSPGALIVEGDADIEGTLQLELGGSATTSDSVTVTGILDLSGARIEIDVSEDFDPTLSTIDLFTAAVFEGVEDLEIVFSGADIGEASLQISSSGTLVVVVDEPPTPEAVDDTAQTDANNSVLIDVLENDGNAAAITSIDTSGTSGRVTLGPENQVRYDPNGAFDGLSEGESDSDTFRYSITGTDGNVSTASVKVTVVGVNDAPVIDDLSVQVPEGSVNITDLSALDVDGDVLEYRISGPDADLFLITQSGNLSFKEQPDYERPDDTNGDNRYELDVTVSDGQLEDNASVVVTVTDEDDEVELRQIMGTRNSDLLRGTDAAEEVWGGAGAFDRLFGGAGADVFVFAEETNNQRRERDIIYDYEVGLDAIRLENATVLSTVETANSVVLVLSDDRDVIYLRGEGVTADNIIFDIV